MSEQRFSILFDVKLRRPGCVLLQAIAGCDAPVSLMFPSQTWLTSPTPDMKRYLATRGELQRLSEISQTEGQ